MKKIFLFLVVLATISSCNKNDDTNTLQVTNNDLIGTWQVVSVTSKNAKLSGIYKTRVGDVPVNTEITVTGKDYNMAITFADNPKKISNAGSFVAVVGVKLPILGEKSFQQTIPEIPATTGDWSVQNNVLTTINNGKSTSINIISYNSSEIIFSYPLNSSLTAEELGSLGIKNTKIEGDLIIKATK